MSPPFTEANNVGLMRVLRQINLVNCVLITISIIFIYVFLIPRWDTDVSFVPPPITKKPAEKNSDDSLKTPTLSPQEYRAIADENLFHPDRIIPPEKKPESVLPKPEFILYGTLITPDLKTAYLEDKKAPVTTPGRGQRQSALNVGESLSGFRVKEILPDKVVMTRGEETIQVLLQEPGSSKARETTPGPGPRTPTPLPIPGPGVTAPVPSPSFPQPASPSFPQPGRPMPTAPMVPGQRSIPSGRIQGLPTPSGQPREIPLPQPKN
jgi:hypothetical protein